MSPTIFVTLFSEVASGFSVISSQWWKEQLGKAWPEVCALRYSVKPMFREGKRTERLSDREETLDHGDWGTAHRWDLFLDVTSSHGDDVVDGSDHVVRAGDLDQEDRLLESWSSQQLGTVVDSLGSWDELTSSSVDTIWVEGSVVDVESDGSARLVSDDTVGDTQVERGDARVSDFVHELAA